MNRSFVALHASISLAEARNEMLDPTVDLVLVRAGTGWQILSADELRAPDPDPEVRLASLLDTAETAPALQSTALAGMDRVAQTTVVMDGNRPIGVLGPDDPIPDRLANPSRGLVHDGVARRSSGAAAEETVQFNADAKVDAPSSIRLGESFTMTVSLAPPAALEQEGRVTVHLAPGVTSFDLDILIFASGFDGPADMRSLLHVDATDLASSTVDFELTPSIVPPEVAHSIEVGMASHWPATITLFFSRNGQPAGTLVHRLDVHVDADVAVEPQAHVPAPAPQAAATSRPTESAGLLFPDLPQPDLTIIINEDDADGSSTGRYTARLDSPHGTAPAGPFSLLLDRSAAAFGANIAHTITKADRGRFAIKTLNGIGTDIRGLLPAAFWRHVNDSLAAGRAKSGQAPTVLLMTSDPHIPWELTELGERPGDENAPSFLAAQARVGRWILGEPGDPLLSPSIDLRVKHLAAVVGEYPEGGLMDTLDEAEAEGELLKKTYMAEYRSATEEEIVNLFDRLVARQPQLMHFACHGKSDSSGNALVANDGREIPDYAFRNTEAGRVDRPFVFLNACRVGRASEVLNRYGGFAATFVRSGCRGFIGPLWEVDDVVARELATRFYEGVAQGVGPAELLRRERARFIREEGHTGIDPPTTLTAYVYYGHPDATISGIHPPELP